jgi:hypothetical protein
VSFASVLLHTRRSLLHCVLTYGAAVACVLQSWGDEDIPELLEALSEALKEQAVVLSSWEKYK